MTFQQAGYYYKVDLLIKDTPITVTAIQCNMGTQIAGVMRRIYHLRTLFVNNLIKLEKILI